MISLGMLLILLIFIYSILGMQLFGYTTINGYQSALNYHANFQTFKNTFLLLIRCTTGEQWNSIMFDCARQHSVLFQCEDSFNYGDYARLGHTNKCGSPSAAYLYFISFNLIVSQIFLNIFIAIVIDAFMNQNDAAFLPVTEQDVEAFVNSWKKFDPDATGFIKAGELELLIYELAADESCELLFLKKQIKLRTKYRQKRMATLHIPMYGNLNKFNFHDVLLGLSKAKFENEFDRTRGQQLKKKT